MDTSVDKTADGSQSWESQTALCNNTFPYDPPCSHYGSVSRSFKPQKLIQFPYRPSVMTLLRRLHTTPRDAIVRPQKRALPNVSGSFQMHWDRLIDVPILTVVGSCDTGVHSPTFERKSFSYGILTVEVVREHERHCVQFEVPLIIPMANEDKTVIMDYRYGFNLGDRLNSYVLHLEDRRIPVLIVNLWNLCQDTCLELHTKAVVQIDGNSVNDEHYVLGMTGVRETCYPIEYDELSSQRHFFLDYTDLLHIGFFEKKQVQKKYLLHLQHPSPRPDIANLFPMEPTKLIGRAKTVEEVAPRYTHATNDFIRIPYEYPPAQTPLPEELPRVHGVPENFPPGYFPERYLLNRYTFTVEQAIDNHVRLMYPQPAEPFPHFAKYFMVDEAILMVSMEKCFREFLEEDCGITKRNNDVTSPKYFKGRKLQWLEPHRHPALFLKFRSISAPSQEHLLDYLSDNDDVQEEPLEPVIDITDSGCEIAIKTEVLSDDEQSAVVQISPEETNQQSENANVLSNAIPIEDHEWKI